MRPRAAALPGHGLAGQKPPGTQWPACFGGAYWLFIQSRKARFLASCRLNFSASTMRQFKISAKASSIAILTISGLSWHSVEGSACIASTGFWRGISLWFAGVVPQADKFRANARARAGSLAGCNWHLHGAGSLLG